MKPTAALQQLRDRLLAGVKVQPGGCWLWFGRTKSGGYGVIASVCYGNRSRAILAHRASWLVHKGAIPAGLLVLHKCDVPACVNPDHLFLGTQRDNLDDMTGKGRRTVGEHVGRGVLTEKMVREIRKSSDLGTHLADRYGVSHSLISQARSRRLWAHVAD